MERGVRLSWLCLAGTEPVPFWGAAFKPIGVSPAVKYFPAHLGASHPYADDSEIRHF